MGFFERALRPPLAVLENQERLISGAFRGVYFHNILVASLLQKGWFLKPTNIAITLCFVMSFSAPLAASGDGATGHDLLEANHEAQTSFLQISMSMAVVVASQTRPDIAECIGRWYPADASIRKERHIEMLDNVKKNPSHNPTVIVLATIQKHCGTFKRG